MNRITEDTPYCVVSFVFYNNEGYMMTQPFGQKSYLGVVRYRAFDFETEESVIKEEIFRSEEEFYNWLYDYPTNLIVIGENAGMLLSFLLPLFHEKTEFQSIGNGNFSPKKPDGSYKYIGDDGLLEVITFQIQLNGKYIGITDFSKKLGIVDDQREKFYNTYSSAELFNGKHDDELIAGLKEQCYQFAVWASDIDNLFPGLWASTTIASYTYKHMSDDAGNIWYQRYKKGESGDLRRNAFNIYRERRLFQGATYIRNFDTWEDSGSRVWKLDVNNMYGNFLANNIFPYGLGEYVELATPTSKIPHNEGKAYFLRVDNYSSLGRAFPAFIPLIGVRFDTLWIPDFLLETIDKYYHLNKIKISAYIEFDAAPLPDGATNRLKRNYENKAHYKAISKAISQAYKTQNNTLYGKFIQRPLADFIEIVADCHGVMVGHRKDMKPRTARSEYLPVGVGTVCYGGKFMLDEIFSHHIEDRVAYIDTDCVVFDKHDDDDLSNWNIGDGLGQWKIEAGEEDELFFSFAQKSYIITDAEKKVMKQITMAGINEVNKIEDNEAFGYIYKHKTVPGGGRVIEKIGISKLLGDEV